MASQSTEDSTITHVSPPLGDVCRRREMEGRRQRREEVGAVFSTVAVAVDGDREGREGERRRGLGRCSARSVAAVGKERKAWNSMVAVTMDDDGGEGGGGGGGGGRWLRVEEVLRRAPAVEERGKGGGSGDRQGRRRGDHGSSSVDDEGEGSEGERRRGLRRCSARAVAAVGEERKPWNSMVAVTMGDGGGEGGGRAVEEVDGSGQRKCCAEHRRWRKEGREVAPMLDKGGDEEIWEVVGR